MADYPVNLRLEGRLCVGVGGGSVGLRKLRGLRAAGARVRLVEPDARPELASAPDVEHLCRPYRSGDLEGALLAFAATGSRDVNAAVVRDARRAGIRVNVADAPEEGDFTLPAVLRRGGLTLAVSTAGGSPALAVLMRDRLAEEWGEEWGVLLAIAAALRQKRLTPPENDEYNQAIFRRIFTGHLPALIAERDRKGIDRALRELFGEGISLEALGVALPTGKP